MAITDWYLAHATTTTAIVCVRSDADGEISLDANGQTFTGDTIATGTNDGWGKVEATGLTAANRYSFTVTVSGSSVSDSLRTMPDTGSRFKIGWFSCVSLPKVMVVGHRMVDQDIVASCGQGDHPYTETTSNGFGISTTILSNQLTNANWYNHYLRCYRNTGFKALVQHAPFYRQWSDHEWPGGGWDHTLDACNETASIAADQADVDAVWKQGADILDAYTIGHPSPPSGAVNEKPSSAAAGTATSNYPPRYFIVRIGDAEIFCCDFLSHCSPTDATDDASKTMLGNATDGQKDQLKNWLTTTTATWKIISSPAKWFERSSDSKDNAMHAYSTERNEILDYIDTNNVKGVFIASGDQHVPLVSAAEKADGDSWDVWECVACPASVPAEDNLSDFSGYTLYQGGHPNPVRDDPKRNVYGIIEVNGSEWMEVWMYNQFDRLLWKRRWSSDSNVPQATNESVAI